MDSSLIVAVLQLISVAIGGGVVGAIVTALSQRGQNTANAAKTDAETRRITIGTNALIDDERQEYFVTRIAESLAREVRLIQELKECRAEYDVLKRASRESHANTTPANG